MVREYFRITEWSESIDDIAPLTSPVSPSMLATPIVFARMLEKACGSHETADSSQKFRCQR